MMRVWWRALLPSALAVCLPMLGLKASAAERVTVADGTGTWQMTIAPKDAAESFGTGASESGIVLTSFQEADSDAVPAPIEPAETEAAPQARESLPAITPKASVDPAQYWAVYRSIPFLRTEYEANPSYRHDAAMEFLFGQLRPTVIHRDSARPVATAAPVFQPYPYYYDRYLGHIPTFLRLRQPLRPWYASWQY